MKKIIIYKCEIIKLVWWMYVQIPQYLTSYQPVDKNKEERVEVEEWKKELLLQC